MSLTSIVLASMLSSNADAAEIKIPSAKKLAQYCTADVVKDTYPNGQKMGQLECDKEHPAKLTLWYENGQKKFEACYDENGQPRGTVTLWYETEVLKAEQKAVEENYVHGVLEGIRTEWYENGQKKKEEAFVAGKKQGSAKEWYETETGEEVVRLEASYTDDHPNGAWTEYYATGKKKQELHYVQGNLEGPRKMWFETGRLQSESNYVNNILEGIAREYYKEVPQLQKESFFAVGKLHGDYLEWHPNGRLKAKGAFLDDKQWGTEQGWYDNGKLQYEGHWLQGKRVGLAREWHPNGKKKHDAMFIEGLSQGKERFWDEREKLILERVWDNGELIEEKEFSKKRE